MNFRSILFLLLSATFSFTVSAAGSEPQQEHVTCTASQQKVYIFYMYAEGFGANVGCLETREYLTQAGMDAMRQQIQKSTKRKIVIQNVIPLKG